MFHSLAHWFGLDNGSGGWYLWWSGVCGDLIYLGALTAVYRHINCHVDGCKRVGAHHVEGTNFKVCRRHHPTSGNSHEQILAAHERAVTGGTSQS